MSLDSANKSTGTLSENVMFNGAIPALFELARNLRKNMTDAESLLWFHLKGGINGHKFRRQHPVAIYIADFYCHKLKLIIEIDGNIHDKPEVKDYGRVREAELTAWGYSIVRYSNSNVLCNIEFVLQDIQATVQNRLEKIKL